MVLNYKLQIGCLIIVLYIAFTYAYECRGLKEKHRLSFFDGLLIAGIIYYIFDILTVYTVNHLDTVSDIINRICHAVFLLSIDMIIFMLFLYMMSITECIPKERKRTRLVLWFPFILNAIVVVANIGTLEFCIGQETNYSMGISAYTCYIMVAVYIIFTVIIFFRRWNYIEKHKRISIMVFLAALILVTGYQMMVPEALISSLAMTINILGIYVNMENPVRLELEQYHKETIYGFANMIESRDGSTGSHVKRTTRYVQLIADELRRKGYYKNVLTKDYIENLLQAAPMHDIGKISTPDAVLQKPGKLTTEEYEQIKLHSVNGGEIIKSSLGNLGDPQYLDIAYKVARHHHEKWNGTGYPDGLKEEEIPLCARIMAVADVFDAVVEKRCYRDAMTLEQGFDIIRKDSGVAFDPLIAGVFLAASQKVEEIHENFK